MNIPLLLQWFEKLKAVFMPATRRSSSPPPLPSPVDKPESDKLAKTVLPNAVQTISPEPAASTQASGSRARMVAVGAAAKRPGDLPPAVALALEPRVERVLSVALSDIIGQMPEGYLKPRESFDATRRVLLKAAEVEKGMAKGKPTMSIAALYQQIPEIFMGSVAATDTSVIQLPFKKLMEELSNIRVRHDQAREQIAAQYQTPFLQVAVEEAEKFGTKMEPVQVAEFPKVQIGMAPATAEAIAAAEPEATAQEKFSPSRLGGGIRSRQSPIEPPIAPVESKPQPPPEITTAREDKPPAMKIPFSLEATISPEKSVSPPPSRHVPEEPLPNGTGESAFPRVPASSGPPVPPSFAAPPTRIPFKLTPEVMPPPVVTAPEPPQKVQPSTPPQISEPEVSTGEPVLKLPLAAILKSIPPIQIGGDISTVSPETKIVFPLTLIAPQLVTGKVVIHPKEFHAALPEAHRNLFLPDAVDAPVQLSLPDVLANLPGDALQMRTDQEVVTQDEIFETPFSTKAAEDAKRFGAGAGVADAKAGMAKTGPEPAEPKPPLIPSIEKPKPESPSGYGDALKIAMPTRPGEISRAIAPAPSTKETPLGSQSAEQAKPRIEAVAFPGEQPAKTEAPPKFAERTSVPAEPRFEAKEAVIQASALRDVASCSVIFADGLSIAGNIPSEMHVDGLSAVAPTLLRKLEKHMLETPLGALTSLTLYGQKRPITFFASGNICLTAVHSGAELSAESRRELASITEKLSRTYAQPGAAHVDH